MVNNDDNNKYNHNNNNNQNFITNMLEGSLNVALFSEKSETSKTHFQHHHTKCLLMRFFGPSKSLLKTLTHNHPPHKPKSVHLKQRVLTWQLDACCN